VNQGGNTEKRSNSEYPAFFRKAVLAALERFHLMLTEEKVEVAACKMSFSHVPEDFYVSRGMFSFCICLPRVLT
jgi:hypothetical protein